MSRADEIVPKEEMNKQFAQLRARLDNKVPPPFFMCNANHESKHRTAKGKMKLNTCTAPHAMHNS
jgi:transcription initiation factor IIE alpha subunit